MYGSYCFIRQNVLVSPQCDVCGGSCGTFILPGGVIEKDPARKACSMEDRGLCLIITSGLF